MLYDKSIDIEQEFYFLKDVSKPVKNNIIKIAEAKLQNPSETIHGLSTTKHVAKAFYNALNKEDLSVETLVKSACKCTSLKIIQHNKPVLLIQDTVSFNYHTQKKKKDNGLMSALAKGVNLHSCLAATTDGVAFGILDQSYISRTEDKNDSLTEEEKKARDIEDKESNRWLESFRNSHKHLSKDIKTITVCDREGDFFEFMNEIASKNRIFLIRCAQNRRTMENERILDAIRAHKCRGEISLRIPRDSRKNIPERDVVFELKYKQFSIKRPTIRAKNKNLPISLTVWVVHILEKDPLNPEEPIEWFLMTNDQITSLEDALTQIKYYLQRPKIEQFHLTLKSAGCESERIQSRTMEVTKKLITIYSIISVFLMNMLYLSRVNPDLACDVFFNEIEWKLLYCIANKTNITPEKTYSIKEAIFYLSCLGGPKRSKNAGQPGIKVIWKGLKKLYDVYENRYFSHAVMNNYL